MDYFSRERIFYARIAKASACWKKKITDGEKLKGIKLEFWIPVTDEIMACLDRRLSSLMKYAVGEHQGDGDHRDYSVTDIGAKTSHTVTLQFFGDGDLVNKDAVPRAESGFDNDDITVLDLKKLQNVDGDWYLVVTTVCTFTESLWTWVGKTWIEGSGYGGETQVRAKPFQAELFGDQDEGDADDEEVDEEPVDEYEVSAP